MPASNETLLNGWMIRSWKENIYIHIRFFGKDKRIFTSNEAIFKSLFNRFLLFRFVSMDFIINNSRLADIFIHRFNGW